jgi:hypothetical protein
MSDSFCTKEAKRARVFALMHQKNQAQSTAARIRRNIMARPSPGDLEQFKSTALRSLQAGPSDLPARLDI